MRSVTPLRPITVPTRGHRLFLAVLLVLSFVWQPWVATSHAAAMASGTAICTSRGNVVLDAQGKAVPSARQGCGDCCSSVTPAALLPTIATVPQRAVSHAAPADVLTAQRLAAQWLAPLSRGPPSLS